MIEKSARDVYILPEVWDDVTFSFRTYWQSCNIQI